MIDGALRAAQNGARLGVVAVHKEPVAIDLVNLMANEITVIGSMGYPTEIFEVTRDLAANWEKYAVIVSHTFGFDDVRGGSGHGADAGGRRQGRRHLRLSALQPRQHLGGQQFQVASEARSWVNSTTWSKPIACSSPSRSTTAAGVPISPPSRRPNAGLPKRFSAS